MKTFATTPLLVVHDQAILEAGIRLVLAGCPEFEAADSVSKMPSRLAFGARPLMIADYRAGMNYLAKVSQTGRPHAVARVLLVTDLDGESEVRNAIAAGVFGYLRQDCGPAELIRAATSVARGERYVAPEIGMRLADSFGYSELTTREGEVLQLMVAGQCNKVIARTLRISLGTVKTHVSAVLEKLRVSSRTQAVVRATERGLLGIGHGGHRHEDATVQPGLPGGGVEAGLGVDRLYGMSFSSAQSAMSGG